MDTDREIDILFDKKYLTRRERLDLGMITEAQLEHMRKVGREWQRRFRERSPERARRIRRESARRRRARGKEQRSGL